MIELETNFSIARPEPDDEDCLLLGKTLESAISEAQAGRWPFVVTNFTLVQYNDQGQCQDCTVIGRSWRPVRATGGNL